MHVRWLAMTSLFFAPSCSVGPEDVRNDAARWSADYAVPFHSMASCIAANEARLAPQLFMGNDSARVSTFSQGGSYGVLMTEYSIRRVDETHSQVEWRRRKLIADMAGLEDKARKTADRCGQKP